MMTNPVNSDKAKLQAARGLINEKRYAEARAILVSVNAPQAADWIMKIDAMAPLKVAPKSKPENYAFWGGLSLITFVAAVALILLAVTGRDFATQAYSGIAGIVALLIAYGARRKAS